jgi:UDP-N-acetylmuramate--alanine ligase
MEKAKKYHFIGIGGIGMSAIARILLDKKIAVSGSDLMINPLLEQLKQKGASIYEGHSAKNISAEDVIVFNSQIDENNPEYQAALALKCPLLHRSDLLAALMGESAAIVVTGTHGKTTTSALLSHVLIQGDFDPTFAVGGITGGLNGRLGKGRYFVAEADESDGSFLKYHPEGAIITNVEADHLDYYKTENALHAAFDKFFQQVKNPTLLFYCGDDPVLINLAKHRGCSYGFGTNNQLRILNFKQTGWEASFDLIFEGNSYPLTLPLIGEHNALNAAAVFGICYRLGIGIEKIVSAFKNFSGVSRRCEKKGEKSHILFLDDYGHHPTEIRKTLQAVKQAIHERRLIVVFQPHRYTRTRDCLDAFGQAFESADALLVTDIYGARETPIPGVNAALLVETIKKEGTVPCTYIPKEQLVQEIAALLRPHDVLITVGAGDIARLHEDLIPNLSNKKYKVGLIFGGRSHEHEISIRSARFVAASLNRDLYDVQFFGIDKEGKWIVGQEAEFHLTTASAIQSACTLPFLDSHITSQLDQCDLFLPILHGAYGEDGTLQGFFEMLDKPYAGPDYRSAAICMDKVLTKRLVEAAGIKTPRDLTFGYQSWQENREAILSQIADSLPLPLYVKPVRLGSSVGITPVYDHNNIAKAIDYAFKFDSQVLVEEGKVGCRELEFAVMGNTYSFPIKVPGPGEKLADGQFVDYEKKYGERAVKTTLNPELTSALLIKGQNLAKKAYEAVGCTGMTRVDFLLDGEGEYWLFEMNAIPGLQQLSLFPKIWMREGVSPGQLCDRLIILALSRYLRQKRHAFRCMV